MNKRMRRSYNAYLAQRKKLREKHIALADKMTYTEYKEIYAGAKEAGIETNNFARTMARDDMRVTRSQAREIYKQMDQETKDKYNIHSLKAMRGTNEVHGIITYMFDNGMIDDRDEFEKSLGY